MENNTRYVIGGSELGRAPTLKKCPMCGGVADYVKQPASELIAGRYAALCHSCGLRTSPEVWPESAGEKWNRRESENARVITTQEILTFRADHTDSGGACACWMETIEGELTAQLIKVSASMDGREVYDWYDREYWSRDVVDAEGTKWRLWDKRPTTADTNNEPWGKVGFQHYSAAAAEEAMRIRAKLDERQREAQRRQAEADRRHMEKLEEAAALEGEL